MHDLVLTVTEAPVDRLWDIVKWLLIVLAVLLGAVLWILLTMTAVDRVAGWISNSSWQVWAFIAGLGVLCLALTYIFALPTWLYVLEVASVLMALAILARALWARM